MNGAECTQSRRTCFSSRPKTTRSFSLSLLPTNRLDSLLEGKRMETPAGWHCSQLCSDQIRRRISFYSTPVSARARAPFRPESSVTRAQIWCVSIQLCCCSKWKRIDLLCSFVFLPFHNFFSIHIAEYYFLWISSELCVYVKGIISLFKKNRKIYCDKDGTSWLFHYRIHNCRSPLRIR